MLNERPLDANPYLKARGESQMRAKYTFARHAGWAFGLVFGILTVLVAYGWDAVQLWNLNADYWWLKLALASVTILPLAVLAGGIAGYVNWLLKLVIWALFGIAAAYLVIHIPFDAATFVLGRLDPIILQAEYLPIPRGAEGSFGMLATLGAFLGILLAFVHIFAVNWAWERSDENYRLTPQGWLCFLLALPLALAFGLLYEGVSNTNLRAPVQLVGQVIESGLNDAPDQDHRTMELHRALVYLTGQQWKGKFSPSYTLYLAASEPTQLGEAYVDAAFDNGNLLRCRITTFGEFAGACYDLNAELARYLAEFVPRGSFRCADCEMQIEQPAAEWRAANARPLDESETIELEHGTGSVITARVTSAAGSGFECVFSGANPVIIHDCTDTN